MIGKTKIVFGLLLASFILIAVIGIVSACEGECQDDSECYECELDYDSCYEEEDEDNERNGKKFVVLDTCIPNWECSGWNGCYNGVKNRICVDDNKCEVAYNQPHETTACDIVEQVKEEPTKNNFIASFIGIILVVLLLIVLVNLFR